MKIKKSQLEVFFKTLRSTEGVLSLADARVRDAFMKPLGLEVDSMMADRKKIYEAYAIKNEEGEIDLKDGQYHFESEMFETVNKELETFGEEVVEVPFTWGVTPSKLKEIVEKSQYKPLYGEADTIDEIIKAII